MTYSVSNEEIKRIAEGLGLKISFNSTTPGVINTTTGEVKGLNDYFNDFFDFVQEDFVEMEQLSELPLRKVKPRKMEKSFDEFFLFPETSTSTSYAKIA